MQKKVIIFDFDGTLADTLDIVVKIANRLSGEFGYARIKHSDVTRLRQESPLEILRKFHVSPFKVPAILRRGRSEFTKEIKKVKTIPGMQKVLTTLKDQGYTLGILTTNSQANIESFLRLNGLERLFDFITGDIGIFGKKRGLQKIIKDKKFNRDEVVYVGDEIRDIAAAHHMGLTIISVSWGFNTHDFLARHKPDFLIDSPTEFLSVVDKLS